MASTAFQARNSERLGTFASKGSLSQDVGADEKLPVNAMPGSPASSVSLKLGSDNTHRRLKSRHIQLIGIGGYVPLPWYYHAPCSRLILLSTIGTALFVQIGRLS